jgi:diguanylate cyclase (GGDEF)-like protein
VVGGEVIGSVLLIRPVGHQLADETRIRESVSQAAPVLANLRNLAIAEIRASTDGLTGLPNKRAVTDALKRLYARAATTGAPLSLLLLDLDHFKQVNDVRGHAVGDQVLAKVGAVLQSVLRTGDFAGRNGGEEFAIILPDTETRMAMQIAERARAAVAEISLPGADVTITLSIGVAGYPDHATTPDRLERLADAALYTAKRHGRNRAEMAEPTSADIAKNLSDAPTVSDSPAIPDSPTIPGAPAISDSPTTSDFPATSNSPMTSGAPTTSNSPATSEAPTTSGAPSLSNSPASSDPPTIREAPTIPGAAARGASEPPANGVADIPRSRPPSWPASPRG